MSAARSPWLPDFCRLTRLAAVLGVAQLVVLVLLLAPSRSGLWGLEEFIAASAFAHWVALTAAVLLCKARPWLLRLPRPAGVAAALALPAGVALFGAWALQQIDLGLGTGLTLAPGQARQFVFGSAALATLIGAVTMRYFYVREQWQAQVQAQTQAAMDALQARIRPHFLFNSMNTIASLVRSDPATAERAVEDLSDLFRAALGADRGEATLAEEIELGRRYLDIEGLRLGARLRVRWQLPEPLPALRLPRLVLQPLLENAVLHGIARLPEGGSIDIAMRLVGRTLEIVIRNPAAADGEHGLHNGHAQDSIAQRLRHRLGSGARLHAGREGADYVCRLHLPLP